MGKKVFSLCMALALCLGLLPVTALAAEGAPSSLYVGNQQVIIGNDITYWTTGTDGKLTASNESGNWNVKYEPGTATLTLSGATIQGGTSTVSVPYGAGIYAQGSNGQSVALTIKLIGENTITGIFGIFLNAEISASSYGTNATLTITGENNGSLGVSGSDHGIFVISGTGNASLTIEKATVTSSTDGEYAAGVCVQSGASATSFPQLSLTVNGGSLTASGTGSSDGIQFYVGSSEATGATTSLTVSENAIVDARNGGISALKISETLPTPTPTGDNRSGIVFDGTEGTVYGDVTLQEDLEIGEGETLTIPEGSSLTVPEDKTITVESGGNLEGTPTGSGTVKIAPTITTESLPDGTVGKSYSDTSLAATGDTPITWSVSNGSLPAGLSLSEDGKITGTPTTEGTSTFTVTATNDNGSDSKEYTLNIKPATVSVTGVTLDQTELSLYTGESKPLTAKVEPNDATNKNVTWESSDSDVATVDQSGNVKAVAPGTANITVKTVDGSHTATCAVTVEKPYTPPPYIPPSKPNWTSVARKLANAQPGDTVTVKMNGETEVPGEVWETIAGRDVTVVLDMGGDVSWTVDGNDVPTATHFADMDFGVDRNTTGIDVDVINAITGEVSSVQITLAHDGEFGFTLTLTAPLGRENAGSWANLYHYDEDAESLSYETSGEIQKDGTASLKMTHASQYAIIIDEQTHQLPFEDVASGAWYEGAVRYAYLHDIMEGMSATTFQPNGTLSRAMAVQIFYNLEGQPDISGENLGYPYEDVDAQAWYGDAVYWARLTGVATGYGDGTFQPGDSITRQEFAQMLYNYAEYKGYDLSAEGDLSTFPDAGSIADWAKVAMSWANGNELINGHDDGTIDAGGVGTRAQAASILMRFDQNLVEK